jgi:hypothetical protein
MPNNCDFSNISDVKIIELNSVEGWISPIYVEYGKSFYGGNLSYFWRVKGTKHTFIIPVVRMDFLSQGKYETHFKTVLQNFAQDYLSWSKENFSQDWMQDYRKQFSTYISI